MNQLIPTSGPLPDKTQQDINFIKNNLELKFIQMDSVIYDQKTKDTLAKLWNE